MRRYFRPVGLNPLACQRLPYAAAGHPSRAPCPLLPLPPFTTPRLDRTQDSSPPLLGFPPSPPATAAGSCVRRRVELRLLLGRAAEYPPPTISDWGGFLLPFPLGPRRRGEPESALPESKEPKAP